MRRLFGFALALLFSAELAHAQELEAPTPETIRKVWTYYYHAKGQRPVLVELVLCLDDRAADAEECKRPITSAVPVGTTVYAWTSWLVPAGESRAELSGLVSHQRKEIARTPLSISGAEVRARAVVRAVIDKQGVWEIAFKQGRHEHGHVHVIAK
jgi:hypothetical protein